jgi:hypothetical protein
MPDSDFLAALRALHEGGVEFAVVGEVGKNVAVTLFDRDCVVLLHLSCACP